MFEGQPYVVPIAIAVIGVIGLVVIAWRISRRHHRARRSGWIPLVSSSATGASLLARPARRPEHTPSSSWNANSMHMHATPSPAPVDPAPRGSDAAEFTNHTAPAPLYTPPSHGESSPNGQRNGISLDPPAPRDAGRFAPPPSAPSRPPAEYSNSSENRPEVRKRTFHYQIPTDQTLQFLPGRLEVVGGREVGQEIRFVRTDGTEGTSISFGRSEGPSYRHVQLFEPTVSRSHARMHFEQRAWRLINLSLTNPVVVNGAPLAGEGSAVELNEGDRIEMGEAVFLFHTR